MRFNVFLSLMLLKLVAAVSITSSPSSIAVTALPRGGGSLEDITKAVQDAKKQADSVWSKKMEDVTKAKDKAESSWSKKLEDAKKQFDTEKKSASKRFEVEKEKLQKAAAKQEASLQKQIDDLKKKLKDM